MTSIEQQLVTFIRSALANADTCFMDDFVTNGPIPGGRDASTRYLLAVALSDVAPAALAGLSGVSQDAAEFFKKWLEAGTRA